MARNGWSSELLDDVFFTRWSTPPTADTVREVEAHLALARQRARGPLIHIAVISGGAGSPPEGLDIDPLLQVSQRHAGVLYLMFEGYERQADGTEHAYLLLEGADLEAPRPRSPEQRVRICGTPVVTRLAPDGVRVRAGLAGLAMELGQRLKWDGEDLLRRARERGLLA